MDHQTTPDITSGRPFRIPVIAWVLGAGLLIALVAIFVFNVPTSTVGYFVFIALMMGSHLFMHAGHGQHGGSNHQGQNQAGSTTGSPSKDEHAGHSGGCH